MLFKLINATESHTARELVIIKTVSANHTMSLDEVLDLVMPENWRDQINENIGNYNEGTFLDDDGNELWYDDLDITTADTYEEYAEGGAIQDIINDRFR